MSGGGVVGEWRRERRSGQGYRGVEDERSSSRRVEVRRKGRSGQSCSEWKRGRVEEEWMGCRGEEKE